MFDYFDRYVHFSVDFHFFKIDTVYFFSIVEPCQQTDLIWSVVTQCLIRNIGILLYEHV